MTSETPRWLLLIHAIPPKPDALRAKVGRRLARIGAVPIKNSVYLIPESADGREDFEWIRREVVEGGGECTVAMVEFVAGLTDAAAVELFRQARDADYEALLEDIRQVPMPGGSTLDEGRREAIAAEVGRFRRRLEGIRVIDFFHATKGADAVAAIAMLERSLSAPAAGSGAREEASIRGAMWVTRRDLHVDRLASAWLIRRFIDPEPRFRFVAPDGDVPAPGERRFDMFDGEYTHEHGGCTFETLLRRFGLDHPPLVALGEIVHDLDLKDGAFGRPEAPGVALLIEGLVRTCPDDAERLRRAEPLFDAVHAAFGGAAQR